MIKTIYSFTEDEVREGKAFLKNFNLKMDLEKKGIPLIKVLRCGVCGNELPTKKMIKESRAKSFLRGVKQRDSEFLAIYPTLCSNKCLDKLCKKEKSKDIVKDLYILYADLLNSTLKVEEIKFDKDNNLIEENGEE